MTAKLEKAIAALNNGLQYHIYDIVQRQLSGQPTTPDDAVLTAQYFAAQGLLDDWRAALIEKNPLKIREDPTIKPPEGMVKGVDSRKTSAAYEATRAVTATIAGDEAAEEIFNGDAKNPIADAILANLKAIGKALWIPGVIALALYLGLPYLRKKVTQ